MKKALIISLFLLAGVLYSVSAYTQGYEGYTKSPGGMVYKIFKGSKDSIKPKTGDWVSMDMRYSTKIKGKDTLLFSSLDQLKGAPVRFQLPPSDFKGDVYEGIGMLSAGDSAMFLINADSLFLKTFKMKQRPEMIDSNSVLNFFVYLISVDSPLKLKMNELEALYKYFGDNNINGVPTKSGIYIFPSAEGTGIKIDSGCMVKLQFTVSLIDGKTIFSSYERPEPLQFLYGKRFDTPGLEEAIGTMKKGGKAKVIVPSIMAFGETGRGTVVPPYATLIYNVEILDVISKADYDKQQEQLKVEEAAKKSAAKGEESVLRDKYLKDHNITVKPTADGLYYIETLKGTGAQAVNGTKVRVHYTGKLLDGTQFDSSTGKDPLEFVMGKHRVIKGWEEGIAMMKQGGKATLIIPSALGYADTGYGDAIPPFATLVFDLELVEVIAETPATPVTK